VLERKAPPTFDVVVEILDRGRLAIHKNVGEVLDALLRGYQPQPEIRQRTASGDVAIVQEADTESMPQLAAEFAQDPREGEEPEHPVSIFPYGVSRSKIERAIHNLRISATIARSWDEADVVLTLKALERRQQTKLKQIASDNVPIYSIIRSRPIPRRKFRVHCAISSTWDRSTVKKSRCTRPRKRSIRSF
jgi:hypothetical protein